MSEKLSLEDYLLSLGKLAVFVQMLDKEQDKYIRLGVLNDEEIHFSETISYECKRLIGFMNDQVKLVGSRLPVEWDKALEKIKERLK